MTGAGELSTTKRRLETAVRRSLAGRRAVLAVSGGRDSMVLMRAAATVSRGAVAMVATFDHGTGPAARRAAALVAREAARLGLPVVVGRASQVGRSEAAWREARLEFLADVARKTDAEVATAHTRDDQVETVLMRVLRDAGARGLAGLFADGGMLRPLLQVTRDEITEFARTHGVPWIEDPANASLAFLRNRVRAHLLPRLERQDPDLPAALLRIARRAAEWRSAMNSWAALESQVSDGRVSVPAAALAARSPDDLAILWPALAARVGLAMDWRGTERVVAFTTGNRVGARIPLAGGWEVSRTRETFELGPVLPAAPSAQPLRPGTRWLGWRFMATGNRRHSGEATVEAAAASDDWVALLPANAPLSVRRWEAGDRMRLRPGVARRVKRFLSDARVTGARRGLWPVVLAGDEIVWIPGVRRSDAAAVRPGRPGVLYRCVPDYR